MHHEILSLDRRALGKSAERITTHYLVGKGYEIREVNYRHERAEVDIIATYKGLLLFIEVKRRRNSAFGHPEACMSRAQQMRYHEVAEAYMVQHSWQGPIRFDFIALQGVKGLTLVHFEDAF